MSLKDYVRYELVTGEPLTVGERTLTPQAQALTVRWPNGGWVWNRPVAVLVEQDGQQERLPIVDATRIAQLALLGAAALFALITMMIQLTKRKK